MDKPNNKIIISGRMHTPLHKTHAINGEPILEGTMMVKRLSGAIDYLPVMVPGKLLEINQLDQNCMIRIDGSIRSYKKHVDGAARLYIKVFADGICNVPDTRENACVNVVYMTGEIQKPPTYRKTPFGRKVSDMVLLVNRKNGKCDQIPFISWGRNAQYAAAMAAGTKVVVKGRLQSREYDKLLENGECMRRTTYEVSAYAFDAVKSDPAQSNPA